MSLRPTRNRDKKKRYAQEFTIIAGLVCLLAVVLLGHFTGKFNPAPTPHQTPNTVAQEELIEKSSPASEKEDRDDIQLTEVIITSNGPIPVFDGPPMDNIVDEKVQVDTYVVKSGDNLWDIAEKLTGNGANWTKLWSANHDMLVKDDARNLDKAGWYVHPGQVITIPNLN